MFELSNLKPFIADVVWHDYYDPHALQDLAVQALTEGFDGPALREMAWRQDDRGTLEPLFQAAMRELGYEVPTRYEAWLTELRKAAAAVAAGEEVPGDGAIWIHNLANRAHNEGLIDDASYRAFDDFLYLSCELVDPVTALEIPADEQPPASVSAVIAKARALLRPVPQPWFETK